MRPPALAVLGLALACTPTPAADPTTTPPAPTTRASIVSTSVSPESLKVDKVGMRDGALAPDGIMDLAFSAEVEGPIDALFLVSVDEKGNLAGQFRANTLVGSQEAPEELGGVLEVGRLSVGIGVVESGKFLNSGKGDLPRIEGRRKVTLYLPNSGTLKEGTRLRLVARVPGGTIVKGPVFSY